MSQQREEAMQITVQLHLLRDSSLHDAESATDVVINRSRQYPDEPVEDPRLHSVEEGIDAGITPCDHKVLIILDQFLDQAMNLVRLNLKVGGKRENRRSVRLFKSH
jgi:hypothetical protein